MNIRTDIDPKSFPEVEERDAKALNEEMKNSAKHDYSTHQEDKVKKQFYEKSGEDHRGENFEQAKQFINDDQLNRLK